MGMNSIIATSVNMFPEDALHILASGKRGDSLTARKGQEKLNKAVTAISKHGNKQIYNFSNQFNF